MLIICKHIKSDIQMFIKLIFSLFTPVCCMFARCKPTLLFSFAAGILHTRRGILNENASMVLYKTMVNYEKTTSMCIYGHLFTELKENSEEGSAI